MWTGKFTCLIRGAARGLDAGLYTAEKARGSADTVDIRDRAASAADRVQGAGLLDRDCQQPD